MPKRTTTKLGEIHRVTYEPTFFEKLMKFLEGLAGVVVVLVIIGLIIG